MKRRVAIIGAGMGGLTAAIRLAQHGYRVSVYEARATPGGLASSHTINGLEFDGGPYILLDRPGLDWVFAELGLSLDEHVPLHCIESVYQVETDGSPTVRIDNSLDATAAHIDAIWPGAGSAYRRFIDSTWAAYQRLQPLQRTPQVRTRDLLRAGAWRDIPFLFRTLDRVLARTKLPRPVQDAIGIWTHVAGHRIETAPAPLAFVPALIHHIGAWYPVGGIAQLPQALAKVAQQVGVELHFDRKVSAIHCQRGRACGVELQTGEFLEADAVLANSHGVGAYLDLLQRADRQSVPENEVAKLKSLPLQSPGVCGYLAMRGTAQSPYLRFYLPGGNELCRLLITPSAFSRGDGQDAADWQPARLMAPMDHATAESACRAGQQDFLDSILAEQWWKSHVSEFRVVATRLPSNWGEQFQLYRDSMNPVMTPQFMRAGRLAHRSPYVDGLYLAGSSTHPGQWVSFCAVSGILAADRLREDFA